MLGNFEVGRFSFNASVFRFSIFPSLGLRDARCASGGAKTSMWEDLTLASGFFLPSSDTETFFGDSFQVNTRQQISTSTQVLSKVLLNKKIRDASTIIRTEHFIRAGGKEWIRGAALCSLDRSLLGTVQPELSGEQGSFGRTGDTWLRRRSQFRPEFARIPSL